MLDKQARFRRFVAAAALVFFCTSVLSGCASFRRKFVRQSKNKDIKEDFVPVLEPVEYKPEQVSPLDSYRSHYSMVKAYFTDVNATLGAADSSGKREVYLLNQIIAHLQEMSAVLSDPRQADIAKAVQGLQGVVKEFDKPAPIRRYDLLKSSVRSVELDVRRKLKPDLVKEFLTGK